MASFNLKTFAGVLLITLAITAVKAWDHPCTRECTLDEPPRRCHYEFRIEEYSTMSDMCYDCPLNIEDCYRTACVAADGWKRNIFTINRQMPGPQIQVCKGDELIVDVNNQMRTDTTSIHWHGIYQKHTPYMDGVPMVTQCPIQPGTTFRYRFPADRAGTSYYHSHSGPQRGIGIYGAVVVRRPLETEPNILLYDYDLPEHVIVLADWNQDPTNSSTIGVLINGMGSSRVYSNPNDSQMFQTPRDEYYVNWGFRYRFRVLSNGVANCPLEISVDNHRLLVIESDGNAIEPIEVDSFVMGSGERYDFVLTANQSLGNYWLKVRGLVGCAAPKAFQYAILRYAEAQDNGNPAGEVSYEAAGRKGVQLNPVGVADGNEINKPIKDLTARVDDDISLKEKPDLTLYLDFQSKSVTPKDFDPATYPLLGLTSGTARFNPINNIAFSFPSFPPLTQPEKISSDSFCNPNTVNMSYCEQNVCLCPHLVDFPKDKTVEIVLVSTTNPANFGNHPIHIHGYSFRVVSEGLVGSNISVDAVKRLDQQGLILRRLHKSPLKDTILIPGHGYTIIRVRTNNPGYWLFHCHISDHLGRGMGLIMKVGKQREMVRPPHNFPRC